LSQLYHQQEESLESKNLSRHYSFIHTYDVYKGNYEELIKEIDRHEQLDISNLTRTVAGKKRLWKYQGKLQRYLHNYVTSAVSLALITSRHYKNTFKTRNQILDYDNRINIINSNPLKSFVKDLRIYTQKYRLPQIVTTTKFIDQKDKKFETFVNLDSDKLIEFSKWAKSSKEYIRANKKIIVRDALEEYNDMICEFTDWFLNEADKNLETDRKKVEQIKSKINYAKLEAKVNVFFYFENPTVDKFEKNIFHNLSKTEKQKIKRISNINIRVETIIEILKEHFAINESIEKRINQLYQINN